MHSGVPRTLCVGIHIHEFMHEFIYEYKFYELVHEYICEYSKYEFIKNNTISLCIYLPPSPHVSLFHSLSQELSDLLSFTLSMSCSRSLDSPLFGALTCSGSLSFACAL